MTYADIAAVQDILAFRILINKVVRSLHGGGPPDAAVVDRLVARLSESPGTRRSLSRRIHPKADSLSRFPTGFSSADDLERPDTHDHRLEVDAVPLLRQLRSGKLDGQEVNKLVGLLSKVDQVLDRDRTRAARSRYL